MRFKNATTFLVFLAGALSLLLVSSGCSSHGAKVAGTLVGTMAGAKAASMGVDRVFDEVWPMQREEDRRELSSEYAKRLQLENELLRQELEERRRGTYNYREPERRTRDCVRVPSGWDCFIPAN